MADGSRHGVAEVPGSDPKVDTRVDRPRAEPEAICFPGGEHHRAGAGASPAAGTISLKSRANTRIVVYLLSLTTI